MRNLSEVRNYLRNYVDQALQRPQMYASSPCALEDVLIFIDQLEHYMLNEGSLDEAPKKGYVQFLIERGYGSGTLLPTPGAGKDHLKQYEALRRFWTEYLASKAD